MKGGSNNALFKDDRFITQHISYATVLDTRLTLTLEHLIKICDTNPSLLTTLTDTEIENIKLIPLNSTQIERFNNIFEDLSKDLSKDLIQKKTINGAIAFAGESDFRKPLYVRKFVNLFLEIRNIESNKCKRKIVKIVSKKLFNNNISDEYIKILLNKYIVMMSNLDKKTNRDELNKFSFFLKSSLDKQHVTNGGFRKNKKKKKSKKMKGGAAFAIAAGTLFAIYICSEIIDYYLDKDQEKYKYKLNSPWFVEVSEFNRETEYNDTYIIEKLNKYPREPRQGLVSINLLQKGIEWKQINNKNTFYWDNKLGGQLPGTFVIRGTNPKGGIAYKLSYVDKDKEVKHLNIVKDQSQQYKLETSPKSFYSLEDLVNNYKARREDSQTENDVLKTRLYVYNKFGIFVKYNEQTVTKKEIYYLYEIVGEDLYRIERSDQTKTIIGSWVTWEYIREKLIEHVLDDIKKHMFIPLDYENFKPIYNL